MAPPTPVRGGSTLTIYLKEVTSDEVDVLYQAIGEVLGHWQLRDAAGAPAVVVIRAFEWPDDMETFYAEHLVDAARLLISAFTDEQD